MAAAEQATFKVVGNQRRVARPQPNEQRLSLDTADIGFKTQDASDGLTMSGLIPALGRKYLVRPLRRIYASGVFIGEAGSRRLTFR